MLCNFRTAPLMSCIPFIFSLFLAFNSEARRRQNPTPPPPPPPTSTASFSDDFSSYQKNVCFNDSQSFGSWNSVFSGYGCNSVVSLNGGSGLSIQPMASTSSSETHAGLVIGPSFSGNYSFQVTVNTAQQLRTGSAPNAWEVGWVLWNYSDNTHFYYFIAKPNGWELGKEDPAYPGAQRFLASGSSPTFPIGQNYQIKIVESSNTMSVYVNGSLITSFTDANNPYSAGKIGLYSEDAHVYFQNVTEQ